jgi:hypothetical protein
MFKYRFPKPFFSLQKTDAKVVEIDALNIDSSVLDLDAKVVYCLIHCRSFIRMEGAYEEGDFVAYSLHREKSLARYNLDQMVETIGQGLVLKV